MNLQKAIERLKQGDKIRLKGWEKDRYLQLGARGKIHLFSTAEENYQSVADDFLSEGWQTVEDPTVTLTYPQMLEKLQAGYACKNPSMGDDPEDYIIYDQAKGIIISKSLVVIPCEPMNLVNLLSDNWEVITTCEDSGVVFNDTGGFLENLS